MPGDVNASDLRLRPPLARRKIDPRGPVSCCTFRLAIHPVDGLRAVQLGGGSSSWVSPLDGLPLLLNETLPRVRLAGVVPWCQAGHPGAPAKSCFRR